MAMPGTRTEDGERGHISRKDPPAPAPRSTDSPLHTQTCSGPVKDKNAHTNDNPSHTRA